MAITSKCVFLGRSLFYKNVIKIGDSFPKITAYLSSQATTTPESTAVEAAVVSMVDDVIPAPKKKMSKAMKAYLQRAKEMEEFMEKEKKEFQIGKRHLANMMGENPDTFTQADIDKSIAYLFPSGLYEVRARPFMVEPEKIFPAMKAAQFDIDGRPFHSMFYTTKPNFFEAIHNIVDALHKLNKYEDDQILKGILPNEGNKANLLSSVWVSKEELETLFIESIHDKDYENFIIAAQKLADHPYSGRMEELLKKYRKERKIHTKSLIIPPLSYDASGRPFIYNEGNRFLTATASVKVWGNGTGKITINGQDIQFFKTIQQREQIIFPLIFSGMENSVDVEATVEGGGDSGKAGAIRIGISRALRSFVSLEMVEKMRIAGLLSQDWRKKERKKPGQEGARRKFTWKKR